jgi:hypothetical protein
MMFMSSTDSKLLQSITRKMEDTFSCNEVNYNEENGFSEINFDSRWVFPLQEMEELTASLPEDNDLYIRVLSYEYGQDYIGYHKYTSGEWCDILADR